MSNRINRIQRTRNKAAAATPLGKTANVDNGKMLDVSRPTSTGVAPDPGIQELLELTAKQWKEVFGNCEFLNTRPKDRQHGINNAEMLQRGLYDEDE